MWLVWLEIYLHTRRKNRSPDFEMKHESSSCSKKFQRIACWKIKHRTINILYYSQEWWVAVLVENQGPMEYPTDLSHFYYTTLLHTKLSLTAALTAQHSVLYLLDSLTMRSFFYRLQATGCF